MMQSQTARNAAGLLPVRPEAFAFFTNPYLSQARFGKRRGGMSIAD
jgi:hypothetical protein